MAIFKPTENVSTQARPYPIILLLDTSGSMNTVLDPNARGTGRYGEVDGQRVEYVEEGTSRIQVLNESIAKMIEDWKQHQDDRSEIFISVVTFGQNTSVMVRSAPISDIDIPNLGADGGTPLGRGLKLAKNLIEDRNVISSKGYRPLVILVSDGYPTDNWETQFNDFISNGRSSKCSRLALAIGREADRNMLGKFVEGTGNEVFEADNIDGIRGFFKFVTMSVINSNKSDVNKNLHKEQPAADDD